MAGESSRASVANSSDGAVYEVLEGPLESSEGGRRRVEVQSVLAEYEEPRFQTRVSPSVSGVTHTTVGRPSLSGIAATTLARPSLTGIATTRQSRDTAAVSTRSQFASRQVELTETQTSHSAEDRAGSVEGKRESRSTASKVLIVLTLLGLILLGAGSLLLGAVAVRNKLCNGDLSCSSETMSDKLHMQLSTLQKQVKDLSQAGGSLVALVNVTTIHYERCETQTRTCILGTASLLRPSCTTDGVAVNYQEVYPFGIHCTVRHGNQTVEQVNSTTTTTSAIDSTDTTTTQRANDSTDTTTTTSVIDSTGTTTTQRANDSTDTTTTTSANDSTDSIRVETTTSSSEILCKCRVKRQFQNVQLLRGAQCRLRVTLCPLVVNITSTDYT